MIHILFMFSDTVVHVAEDATVTKYDGCHVSGGTGPTQTIDVINDKKEIVASLDYSDTGKWVLLNLDGPYDANSELVIKEMAEAMINVMKPKR